jgi:SDR family mycofactocin-dependent oxidoreductase
MSPSLQGQVAFITGGARGQGRSHAICLAEQGADIITVDICAQIGSVAYPLSTPDDLAETVKMIKDLGRRVVAQEADVRDVVALQAAVDAGLREFGRLDIVVANAGIAPMTVSPRPDEWKDVIDINLTGVYNTVEVALPTMIEGDRGGAIVLTSSTAGLTGSGRWSPGSIGYTAAKHGVVGLMRTYANMLAPHRIRVNSVHPTGVSTPMVLNEAMDEYLAQLPAGSASFDNALPVSLVEAIDISNAVVWLVSDTARYVTGISLPVDAGYTNRH